MALRKMIQDRFKIILCNSCKHQHHCRFIPKLSKNDIFECPKYVKNY